MARVLSVIVLIVIAIIWLREPAEQPAQKADAENQKAKDTQTLNLGMVKLKSEFEARRQQKIAEPRDPKSPFKQRENANWKSIEADNGAVFRVDLNSIRRGDHNAEIVIYIVQGETYNPGNLRQFIVDCDGHQIMDTSAFGIWSYAPPRSVGGQIERIACGR